MRKLVYSVDCSLDGFIARENHAYDFLVNEGEHFDDFMKSMKNFDMAVMGKNTYEVGLKAGVIDPTLNLQQFVISSTLTQTMDERIKIVSKNATKFVDRIKHEKGNDILLSGGSSLAGSLITEKLVDEIHMRLHPVLIGSGIPIFKNSGTTISLDLKDQKAYSNHVILVSYAITY